MLNRIDEIETAGRRRFQMLGCGAAVVLMLGFASIFGASHSAAARAGEGPPASAAEVLRVGTYDSRAVAVAYLRSASGMEPLNALRAEHDRATRAHDAKAIADIEARATSLQVRRHLQGFSTAPVDDILETVHDKLEDVAAKSNVAVIACSADYQSPAVEIVDVTDALVALFSPDRETLKMIKDLRAQAPEPIEKIAQLPAVK